MKEARKNPRIGPLLIRAEYRDGVERREGYVTNLSLGGAFLATDAPPRPGSRLRVRISLPWGLGDIKIDAEVVWSAVDRSDASDTPCGVGLAFAAPSPETAEKLHLYLQRFYQLAASIEELA